MFFKKTKELQSLVDASRDSLEKAEKKIEERNILLADMQKENMELYKENKELNEFITKIEILITANKYNNEKVIFNRIKELINDYYL